MELSAYKQIHIQDFSYDLPDHRIAKYPLEKRDQSKLLVYRNGEISEDLFSSLSDYVLADSLMIFNNTKVIQARLHFQKPTGAAIEIFCLEPYRPHDYSLIFQQTQKCSWVCLVGNLKKWKEGELIKTVERDGKEIRIKARKLKSFGDSHIIEFEWDGDNITFADLLETVGELPIPPYLNRETEEKDKETYQTLYSRINGSVAAPTAGLHFTEEVFGQLKQKGIQTDEVTLHVGAGTFKPVKTETIEGHTMHAELISVPRKTIENLLHHTGKVIAVGTTSVRTLESLYHIGVSLENKKDHSREMKVSQWQPYENSNTSVSKQKALENLLRYLDENKLENLLADTQIMIVPGYEFRIVDGMITNFHQPQSTLLLLVSAFVKGNWKNIYEYALKSDFRFLSYGDSSLLLK